MDRGFIGRWAVRGGVAVGLMAVVMLAPELWGFTPSAMRERRVETGLLGLGLVVLVARGYGGRRPGTVVGRWCSRIVEDLDRNAERALGWGLPLVVGVVSAGFLVVWAPTYLARPWFRDVDAFASLAMGWDRGVMPYRDVAAYNFPGHIYLCWVLGKVFGWGRTAPYQAFDLGLFVGLLVTLWFWSGRRLGCWVPGAAAIAGLIGYYINCNYMMIPERDWQAALLAAVGMLWVDGWPGRRAVAASAMLTAVAAVVRPHVVMMFPAIGAVIVGSGGGWREMRRWGTEVGVWGVVFGGCLALLLVPIVANGLVGDWVRGLAVASYGGPYAKKGVGEMVGSVVMDLRTGGTGFWLVSCALVVVVGPRGLRSFAVMMVLGIAGALAWKALHPTEHVYLSLPRDLFTRMAIVVPAGLLLSVRWVGIVERYVMLCLVLYFVGPRSPERLSWESSGDALRALARGGAPSEVPNGCEIGFRDGGSDRGIDRWREYQAVLEYLRRETAPGTAVANVLGVFPYLSINGPAGRVDPFRAESGICWMVLVDEDRDEMFAENLERAGEDVVVVWSPAERPEPRLALPAVRGLIREKFAVEARFGRYEVWRRRE